MKFVAHWLAAFAAASGSLLCAQTDTAPHVQFVNVEDNVKLEVLDWGGSGQPVVLLTGLGSNAHVYDEFASKLLNPA
jgi:hypothetical protein